MRSKLLIPIIALLFAGCSPKSIPDKQAALPDSESREGIVETVKQQQTVPGTDRFTSEHESLLAEIEAGRLQEALSKVEKKIYGPQSMDKVFYTSPQYGGFLALYVNIGQKIKAEGTQSDKEAWTASEVMFSQRFLDGCVGEENGICEMLQQSLRAEATTVWILLELAEKSQNPVEKMNLLEAAYDVQNKRRSDRLDEAYLVAVLDVLSKVEDGKITLDVAKQRKNLLNVTSLLVQTEWALPDVKKKSWISMIKPWEYKAKSNQALNDVRKLLVPYLPVYSATNNEVKEGMKISVTEKLVEIADGRNNLQEYPAYADIDLQTLLSGTIEASYLAVEMYFQNVAVTDANAFVENVKHNKAQFVDEVYEASKLLVRWDVAQLGVDSSNKLAAKLGEQETVNNAFFQEVLDWSKTLTPVWTEFHTVRLWSIKTFVEANIRHSQKYEEVEAQEFFTSVNRNILRAVTFPNMMAFAYKMAQSEWKATIRILWFTFDLDSELIMDYLMTGQYYGPWFNFTNLKEQTGWYDSEKTSLYRSDMYDALYYMFTTRTAEKYDITPSDYIKLVAETLIKQRRSQYEKTLQTQKQIYFQDNSPAVRMTDWCDGVRSGNFEPENIPFYKLSMFITPNLFPMEHNDLNGTTSLYWGDSYKAIGSFERLHSTNDRYRLELEPIFYTLSQYLSIVDRIAVDFPSLNLGDMTEAKDQVRQFEHIKMTYLGVQKAIMKQVSDCIFVAEREAKRRIMAAGFAQAEYYSKVVHPLMTAVKSGELTVDQANQVIQDFHGNQRGVQDYIEASEDKDPIFVVTQVTFLLRTKMFLTRGLEFNSPYTEPVKIEPIVGPHLEIPVPSNFLEDVAKNPYISPATSARRIYSLQYQEDKEVFTKAAVTRTTDESRMSLMADRFSEWDQHELREYAFNFRYVVEHQAIFAQLAKLRYYDVEKPNCWVTTFKELGEDCVKEETPTLAPIIDSMKNILLAYRLDDESKRYFELTGVQGWVGNSALSTIVEYDSTMKIDYFSDAYPYSRISGLLDYPYQLLNADVLGIGFQTYWDVEQSKGNDRPSDFSCAGQRNGCYWGWEKSQAQEFFWARAKRPGFIFNYDYQIVADDFERMKAIAIPKFERLMELEENSAEYIAAILQEDESLRMVDINLYMKPSPLYGLNVNFRNNKRLFEQFFAEETESYFLKEHNWVQELKIQ